MKPSLKNVVRSNPQSPKGHSLLLFSPSSRPFSTLPSLTMARISGALLEYNFKRSECLNGAFHDNLSAGNLPTLVESAVDSIICLGSNGVQANNATVSVLTSSTSVAQLLSSGSSSYSFEFWLRNLNISSNIGNTLHTIFSLIDSTSSALCPYNIQVK